MTYQMALLESKLEGEERGRESVALNMITEGFSFEQIQKLTKLSIEKIQELAKNKID